MIDLCIEAKLKVAFMLCYLDASMLLLNWLSLIVVHIWNEIALQLHGPALIIYFSSPPRTKKATWDM